MSMQINKSAYEKLIKEDIEWLLSNTKDSLERRHIVDVLNYSSGQLYASSSSDLEEAADEMALQAYPKSTSYSSVYDMWVDDNAVDRKFYREGIIAGAKWQAQKDRLEIAEIKAKLWQEGFDEGVSRAPLPEDSVLFKKGVEEGKRLMMEEAVEGEVCGRVYDHINVRFADGICKFLEPKNISHIPADVSKYKVGDKVRVIVLKKED